MGIMVSLVRKVFQAAEAHINRSLQKVCNANERATSQKIDDQVN